MPERYGLDVGWDLQIRSSLRHRVSQVLAKDPRVERVTLTGSLASGQADRYSDVDLIAHLKAGFIDRDVFFDLPRVMDGVGARVIDGWGFAALPHHYVGTFYFEGMPLFWHVDIDCVAAAPQWHIDGSDLLRVPRWEQRFKMWIEAALRWTRIENRDHSANHKLDFEEYMSDMKMRIAKRIDLSSVSGNGRDQLSKLLDMETDWHRQQGFDVERIYRACDELRGTIPQ